MEKHVTVQNGEFFVIVEEEERRRHNGIAHVNYISSISIDE